jgi:hypothetical protein
LSPPFYLFGFTVELSVFFSVLACHNLVADPNGEGFKEIEASPQTWRHARDVPVAHDEACAEASVVNAPQTVLEPGFHVIKVNVSLAVCLPPSAT